MLKRFLRRKDSCPDEDQLICFLEDRCQQAERVQIENHLHSCPACREALALLKEWLPYRRELASLIPSAAVDPDLWIRLNQKLEKESGSCKAESSRRSIRRLPLPQWGTVAAGITLLVVLSWILIGQRPDLGPAATATAAAPTVSQATTTTAAEAAAGLLMSAETEAADAAGTTEASSAAAPRAFLLALPAAPWHPVIPSDDLPFSAGGTQDQALNLDQLLPQARSAIWVEPDCLIAALPGSPGDALPETLTRLLPDLTPPVTLEAVSRSQLKDRLLLWLADDAQAAGDALIWEDCYYLILKVGGS